MSDGEGRAVDVSDTARPAPPAARRRRVRRWSVAVGVAAIVGLPGTAFAATDDAGITEPYPLEVPDDEVEVVDDGVEVVPTEVAGEGAIRADDRSLPFTGGDLLGLAAIGLTATATGVGLRRFSRRPAA